MFILYTESFRFLGPSIFFVFHLCVFVSKAFASDPEIADFSQS